MSAPEDLDPDLTGNPDIAPDHDWHLEQDAYTEETA